jgi:very-short-patch-repair endonuclease
MQAGGKAFREEASMNDRMIGLARDLRRRQTRPEEVLWNVLRNRRELGHKFRRQVPIGRFIADFACLDRRLIVEIDGPVHLALERATRDAERDRWLLAEGFRVLRLTADEVIGDPELAAVRIRRCLAG